MIDEKGESYSARSDFGFEVFFITEYLSRDLYKHRFKYKDVNKLIIYIESTDVGMEYNNIFRTLNYRYALSYSEINQSSGRERTERILSLIESAASAFEIKIPGLQQVMHDSIESFRNGGYKNIWLFKKKRVNGLGNVELLCELDRDTFTLSVAVINKNSEIYKKEILKTKPDSIMYHHKFKNILADDNAIVITDRFDKPFCKISRSEMS